MISNKLLSSVKLIAFDFDGVFTDNTVYVTQCGVESVRCWRSDGIGLSRLKDFGIQAIIISTEANSVVTTRAKKLKIPCKQGVADKADAILKSCAELGVSPDQTMFIGNDVNDIPAFKAIKFPVAVADAYPEVLPYVLFSTEKSGGFGAVREVCDLICQAKSKGLIGL
jgi:3-deoxy-D-manno-octulosonate 8-phosphate phosphatase (KDO 8-P phosphatase)